MDPYPRGSDWMPITPKTGALFHADLHSSSCRAAGSLNGHFPGSAETAAWPKDYENLADTLAAFISLACIRLALRRLART